MKKKISDRLNNRPTFTGQKFTKKSMTIPGQDMTPAEIVRNYVQKIGQPTNLLFSDEPLHEMHKLDKMSRLDMAKALKKQTQELQQLLTDQTKLKPPTDVPPKDKQPETETP